MDRPAPTRHSPTTTTTWPGSSLSPWWWFAGTAALLFLVPVVGSDLIGLQRDLYHLVYFTIALGWFLAFLAAKGPELRDLWGTRLRSSLVVGAVVALLLVGVVLRGEGTDRPDGWRLAFEVLWRGLVYGAVDALSLFVLPAAIAFLVMHGDRTGRRRTLGFAGLALALSMLVSAVYHLGYPEYRDSDLRSPEIGTVLANLPTVLTGNPVGALVAHPAGHVTAVVHQNEGGETKMLPPEVTSGYPDRGSSDVATVLAVAWMVLVGGGAAVLLRRRRTVPGRGSTGPR
ncbi:hypothetical protein ACT8ZV_13580 [Nocardioides sp. MAHUQ-72]|uniref:hypothetical protein n=1 Tax=unclassified Nocardioides TaxID=2615069 RepID=UPI0036159E4E